MKFILFFALVLPLVHAQTNASSKKALLADIEAGDITDDESIAMGLPA